jgi:hypothetical protein
MRTSTVANVTITLPRPHPAQRTVKAEAQRFNVLSCGRRWGKTEHVIGLLVETALAGKPAGYFAPGYKYVLDVWRRLAQILSPLIKSRNFTNKRLELITGGIIEMWTLDDAEAGRSRKYALAVIDEAGLVPNLVTIFQESIRPTLMDYSGAAWFTGTPKGHNDFYHLWQLAGERDDWMSWQRPTHDNPYIDTAELVAAQTDMTEDRYRQEILAEFLADGAGVFRYVREAVYGPMLSINQLPEGPSYTVGVDLGKVKDRTWFVVGEVDTGRVVYLERMLADYTVQLDRLTALCDAISPQSVVIESNIGQMFIEQARKRKIPVVPFATTAASKQPLIENLVMAFEHRSIQIPDDAMLINELMAFDSERLPSGITRYGAPEGQHDDGVIALALCLYGMGKRKRRDVTREAVHL